MDPTEPERVANDATAQPKTLLVQRERSLLSVYIDSGVSLTAKVSALC